MGYTLGMPSLKLSNTAGKGGKHCGNFKKVTEEALEERLGQDLDINHNLTQNNEYLTEIKKAAELQSISETWIKNYNDRVDKENIQIEEEIKKEADVNSNLIGINLRKNSGQDSAILAGLNYAKGNWIVIMDDDLQHSPSDIIKLYNEVKKGYDVCYANFEQKKQKFWKNAGSWFNGKVSEIVINKPKDIYLSPFKIMSRSVVTEMIKFNNLYPYIDGLIFQITNKITQIDIEHHEREIGKSNYSLIKSMKVFFRMLFGFSTKPLTFAAYTGFFVSILGFILLVKYFVDYLMGKADVAGWTTIVILILFIGGLLLMLILKKKLILGQKLEDVIIRLKLIMINTGFI